MTGREKKRIKKSYVYERNCVYMHGYYSSFVYLHIFSSTDIGVFALKYTKLSTFCILQIFTTTDVITLSGFLTWMDDI